MSSAADPSRRDLVAVDLVLGVGKTMLAIALGLKAVHAGYRDYTTAADLVARSTKPPWKAAGRPRCASGTARSSS